VVRAREGGEEGQSNISVGRGKGGLTVRLPDLEDGVAPSEGEWKSRVGVENSLVFRDNVFYWKTKGMIKNDLHWSLLSSMGMFLWGSSDFLLSCHS